jgi:Flp pilus assembly protein TadD
MPGRLLALVLCVAPPLCAAEADDLVRQALAAEARWEPARALALLREADLLRPDDAGLQQMLARQYTELVADQAGRAAQQRCAELALAHARRAAALQPDNAVNVLSLAVCHGALAGYGDPGTRVEYSRLVRTEAERALALDPDYAWAHHILGRWHGEAARLSSTARFFVGFLYGGLPGASPAEAVRHLRRATELEPDELNHWLELGFAYAATGQAALARTQWEHGLAMPSRHKHDEPAKQRAREALAGLD